MKILKIVAIVVVVLVIAALALPFLIDVNVFRPTIESDLSTALGRQVKVGNLRLSILGGSVAADDLSISDDPAFSKEPFIHAKALGVGVELMPLIFSKQLKVTELTIEEPQVVLLRTAAGKWNFSSLGGKTEKPAAKSSGNPDLSVGKLSVKEGKVSIDNISDRTKPQVYQHVNITVQNFSFASKFPFTLTADLPGGGNAKLDGTAGPIDPTDASQTPVQAKIAVNNLNLAASGYVDPASGIAGIADFNGSVSSDGKQARSSGTASVEKLKVSPKGTPAGRSVVVKFATIFDQQKQAGDLTEGDITIGKALAKLTGSYQLGGPLAVLNMKLNAENMPVDDLVAMLPAMGIVLPSGSSLKGGTLTANFTMVGPVDKLVINGPVKMENTKLAGFDLGSKMSAISALTGAKTGSDTTIQNLSADAHVAPDGISTQNVNLNIPALGVVTGSGTISPQNALNYKMAAKLSGSVVSGLTQLAGMGNKNGSIPFFIQGTTSDPKFVPDVKGMLGSQLPGVSGQNPAGNIVNGLSGLFGKKKKP
ncbi:MAG: AsmA family protein [Terriglobales bacterium]